MTVPAENRLPSIQRRAAAMREAPDLAAGEFQAHALADINWLLERNRHLEAEIRLLRAELAGAGTPDVTGVRVVHGYVVEVTFADGTVGAYDFTGKLRGPVFEALHADYELFRSVRVEPEMGTIVWQVGNDPDAWPDWAPEELYEHIRAQYEDADHRLLADEPEDHPAANQETADSEGVGAAEFAGVPATGPGPGPLVLRTDLNAEDDDGHGLALVASEEFQPDRVYPGARVIAGNQPPGAHALVTVLRTELFETTGGEVKVLVTFDMGGSAQS